MRTSFFEKMEREIDIQKEYVKIDEVVLNERYSKNKTLNDVFSDYFRSWKYKRNFLSFDELREYLGFTYYDEGNMYETVYNPVGIISEIGDFLCYCELIYNMIALITSDFSVVQTNNPASAVLETIKYDVEELNYEFVKEDDKYILVQKDAAASAVAEIVNYDLGKEIIRYNHHVLKGDINSKKTILKDIAHALEPKQSELKKNNLGTIERDFFYMVNNMDIRHNNCDINDTNKDNAKFAVLSDEEKEKWYDEIYQEALMAYLSLEQLERNKRIADFKNN